MDLSRHRGPFYSRNWTSVQISANPIELFSLFFDDEVIGAIVREIYAFAEHCLPESSETWSTNVEIRAYIGFNILIGINRLPELRDYWSK